MDINNRILRVDIGPLGAAGKRFEGGTTQLEPYGYDILVDIERDDSSKPDTAKVIIRGLADSSVQLIRSTGAFVRIWAGYDGQDWMAFEGDIDDDTIDDMFTNPGREISFEAGEGRKAIRWGRIEVTYNDALLTPTILFSRLAAAGGFKLGRFPSAIQNEPYTRPWTFHGPIRRALDSVAEDAGVKWSVQKGILILSALNQAVEGEEVPLLSSRTGLVGSVVKGKKSIKARTKWQPGILPRRKAVVESKAFNGVILMKATREKLTSRGQDFDIAIAESKELPA